jgi:cyclic pyranopterin phosphate synthase
MASMNLPILQDQLRRPMRSLRISVTDQCNLRCGYCMPEESYTWLPRSRILKYGQITHLVRAATRLGVNKVRLTGGEPLLRKELWRLIEQLDGIDEIDDLAMTTNGVLLVERGAEVFSAGLQRLTVSLDTLRPKRFKELTRGGDLSRVLAGLEFAQELSPTKIKINFVVMAGVNDDELESMLDWALDRDLELRFIEYMDVAGATGWSRDQVFSSGRILERIEAAFGAPQPAPKAGTAPANRFHIEGRGPFGVIASTSSPFCGTCDRARLTADGTFFTCLYSEEGTDLGTAIRAGQTSEQLTQKLADIWTQRSDRGAEERLALAEQRGILATASHLRTRPQSEMHSKGG